MELKCSNPECEREWEYKGKSNFYATCPSCLNKVKINKKKDKEVKVKDGE